MLKPDYSFIILTFNEARNLPRLLDSIQCLHAATYLLDSGSTDGTLEICSAYGVELRQHFFENHPKQWDIALKSFQIETPWVICLDADQVLGSSLIGLLQEFKAKDFQEVNGIYFNRRYIFKGKWIRYGGHYPKYLLKMFRYAVGYSDLGEYMDHRFIVPGRSVIWKNADLLEENLKEDRLDFWIAKHNTYSNLLAAQYLAQHHQAPVKLQVHKLWFGLPDERKAFLKALWMRLPLLLRPFLYFGYRFIFQLGFLDGRTGWTYHFLHAFWFRLIVDLKVQEQLKTPPRKNQTAANHFLLLFVLIFGLLYGFNLLCIGLTVPGGIYNRFLDNHLNYIEGWRMAYLSLTKFILELLDYQPIITDSRLTVPGSGGFRIVYTCLGYGLLSFFCAFVLAYPIALKQKTCFLFLGISSILLLNTCRLTVLACCYQYFPGWLRLNHHDLFNISIYLIILIALCLWTTTKNK